VATLRANPALKAVIPGGIHEGFAPEKTSYPMITYQRIYTPYDYYWGSLMLLAGFDVKVWGYSSVDAGNIDALVLQTLHDASLSVDGQSTLICRRSDDLDSQEVDDEGKKVYMVGGTYEIWTDQTL
jgi:hypothetical protein